MAPYDQIEAELMRVYYALPDTPEVAVILQDLAHPYITYPADTHRDSDRIGMVTAAFASLQGQLAFVAFGQDQLRYNLYIHPQGTLIQYHLLDLTKLVLLFPSVTSRDGLLASLEQEIVPLQTLLTSA